MQILGEGKFVTVFKVSILTYITCRAWISVLLTYFRFILKFGEDNINLQNKKPNSKFPIWTLSGPASWSREKPNESRLAPSVHITALGNLSRRLGNPRTDYF